MISDFTIGIITKAYKPYNAGERVSFNREQWAEAERQGCIRKAEAQEIPVATEPTTQAGPVDSEPQPVQRKRGMR